MASNLIFKLVVEEAGKDVYTHALGYEEISSITSSFNDSEDNNDFFALAAKHPSTSVRENVAYKDKISEEVVKLLAGDKSIPVLRNLVRTDAFKKYATLDEIEKLIHMDSEIASSIADNHESYEHADSAKLVTILMSIEDPYISYSLARNYNTPKKILKELLKHSDPNVVQAAKSQLED
jgi:hypothetical protein